MISLCFLGMGSIIFTPNLSYSLLGEGKNILSAKLQLPQSLTGTWLKNREYTRANNQSHRRRKHIFKVFENRVAHEDGSTAEAVEVNNKIKDMISCIKILMVTIKEGRISVSAYDTAWIALIKNIDGFDTPQFPSSLEWVLQNQHPDGSWGDQHFFSVYDRLLNTMACIIALKSWNVGTHNMEKGISYVKKNVWKLEDASEAHMTCGFEVIYPALVRKASHLGIHDIPIPNNIYTARDHKLNKIPKELMHQVTTTLLYSLEGLEDLDWSRLIKLQSADGSFFTSPSSTAFAFMETKDTNCLKFITNIVHKFHGGAPHTYPVDLFSRLWVVDRLQRLGISRFFEAEIKDYLAYVYRFWSEDGIYSARDINYSEVDDTSMAFRLLRLQGYDVNPNTLRKFKEGEKFCCHKGEVTPSTTPMYALYRASQIRFAGEEILEEAYHFSCNFLQHWLAGDQLLDKWVVSKDLSNEIKVGLEMPWYATLPRVETVYYLQHYGGSTTVWIAKTLYRMPDIDNDEYLELAKLDFGRCQFEHQIEWNYMQGWYKSCKIQEFGMSRKEMLVAYFLAAATIFEPERVKERIVWAKSQLISKMIRTFLEKEASIEQKSLLLKEFRNNINGSHKLNSVETVDRAINVLLEAIYELSEGFDECIGLQLKNTWYLWLMKFDKGEDENLWEDAELLVTTLNICSAHFPQNDDILFHHEYITLSKLVNKICHYLSQIPNKKMLKYGRSAWKGKLIEVEADMQALAKLVLEEPSGLNRNIKQTFLCVAKTFYYSAYFDVETIELHIFKVLFEPIV
uniref:Copalyl diphosphate synthase 3 n=1 Tax=Salvia miltiorrhiza f. alba TaxID=424422 RepID=A0A0A7ANG5_SALMI|nr:copalyl diphosphate synthase 3 [Salvia miltiorrhiza f. alba]